MDLKPSGGDHPLVKLELLHDGTQVNYGVKDADTFGVDEEGVYKIRDEQLPIQANLIIACGVPQSTDPVFSCEDPTNYLFDIVGGTMR